MTTMTFDPASFRNWRTQFSEFRRPPGARGFAAVAISRLACALIWVLALTLVVGVPVALVAFAMRLAG